LKDLFRQAGTILRADVALGPDNRSRGFGTVVFATEADTERAAKMFNGLVNFFFLSFHLGSSIISSSIPALCGIKMWFDIYICDKSDFISSLLTRTLVTNTMGGCSKSTTTNSL